VGKVSKTIINMIITQSILDDLTAKAKDGAYHPLSTDEVFVVQ